MGRGGWGCRGVTPKGSLRWGRETHWASEERSPQPLSCSLLAWPAACGPLTLQAVSTLALQGPRELRLDTEGQWTSGLGASGHHSHLQVQPQ